ncbi:hypothetical protein [Microbacterium excoecariae]|uniref:hypothetical protein n=1 Tax=Microbacterium excoecariae TaxID=2715210 RepID=UPI001407950B|nr:hypothetical protein [Microbacterium excoecariae]NHI17577.1 hypothetical protein [Microbacterium excoecariae]
MLTSAALTGTVLGIVLTATLGAALTLVLVDRRATRSGPLLAAAIVTATALVVAALAPVSVPLPIAAVLALIAVAVAVLGGDPAARRVLASASGGALGEGPHGGLLLRTTPGAPGPQPEVMRGGAAIGFLERGGAALAIVVGYPEAIAVVVAIKGIARFTELGTPEARERFIIGTLASLGWAAVAAATARLAIW